MTQRRDKGLLGSFSSEKNKVLLFLKKKKQKDFCSRCWATLRAVGLGLGGKGFNVVAPAIAVFARRYVDDMFR